MESRDAGYGRSERVLRWMAAGLGAGLFVAALACGDVERGDPVEQVAYVEAGGQAAATAAAAPRERMPVSAEPTGGAPEKSSPAETGQAAAPTADETPEPETAAAATSPPEHYDAGIAAWRSGDAAAAEAHLREWIAHAPDHVKGRVNLARVLIEIGRPREAKEHAKLAVDIDPGSVAARRVLARALAEAGDAAAALAMYEEALWLDPDDRWSLNNTGHLLILRGRHEEAVGPLALAVRLDSANAMFRSNLGAALEGAGHPAAALEAFAGAEAVDPGRTRAAAAVARLRELLGEDAVPEVDTDLLAENYRKGLMGTPEGEEPDPVDRPWRGD